MQILLAVLLVSAGEPVPMETLVERLWPEDPREGSRDTLYTYISRLRAALGPDMSQTTPCGYRLIVEADTSTRTGSVSSEASGYRIYQGTAHAALAEIYFERRHDADPRLLAAARTEAEQCLERGHSGEGSARSRL